VQLPLLPLQAGEGVPCGTSVIKHPTQGVALRDITGAAVQLHRSKCGCLSHAPGAVVSKQYRELQGIRCGTSGVGGCRATAGVDLYVGVSVS
jgi:hypothetical protein